MSLLQLVPPLPARDPLEEIGRRVAPVETRATRRAGEALHLIGRYMAAHDPDAYAILGGVTTDGHGLMCGATAVACGYPLAGATIVTTTRDSRDALARLIGAPVLEHVGGAVAGPGGLRVLVTTREDRA